MKKKLAAAAGVVLLVAAVAVYQTLIVLPPADPAAKTTPGEKAPAFALAATTAPKVGLEDLARVGQAAVLVFYRGDW